jgi:hypothetical protein
MTFSISQFQAAVANRGLARQNRFQVIIPKMGSGADGELFILLCQAASLPGATIQVKKQNLFGPAYIRPTNINYGEQLSLSFFCDKDMIVKRGFDEWIHQVINKSSFTVAYQSSYARDVIIHQLDNAEKIVYGIKLVDAFPISMGALSLSQSAVDRFHILPITLAYRYWEYHDSDFNSATFNPATITSQFARTTWNSRPRPESLIDESGMAQNPEFVGFNITPPQ